MSEAGRQLPLGVSLSLETRLEDFVPGANQEVLDAFRQRATQAVPGCLYLHGPRASGKSHLLQGLCRRADELGRGASYLPLGEQGLDAPAVLSGWEALDLVCLDNLDWLAGESAWERALLSLYEGLGSSGGSLVVAARRPPAGIGLALPDLASRLASGPVYQLKTLDENGLEEALRRRLERRGLELPADCARWLLRRARRDMHSLSELADRLDRLSLSAQRRLTVPFLREVLGPLPAGEE